MKASLVFVGSDNIKYPNIHGKSENYRGGLITRQMQGDSFKNIQSRYLAMMRQQLGAAQTSVSKKDYIDALNDAQFTAVEGSIENELANQYNQFADGINASYQEAALGLQTALSKKSKAEAVDALNQLISLFKDYDNENSLVTAIQGGPLTPVYTKLGDLIKVNKFIKMIEQVTEKGVNFSPQWLSSLLTQPSEVLAAVIDAKAASLADSEILDILSKNLSLVGTEKSQVTADFGQGGTLTIDTKAADIHLQTRNVKLNETVTSNQYGLNIDGEITVDTYGSVKAYCSFSPVANLTSYSGSNSILMATLHKIYGNNDLSNYQIYNTLAFQSYKGDILDKNYRIIRSDMIAEMAEKYLIGFNSAMAQSIIIHNYTAYPVLGILTAIAEQGKEKTLNGNNYGSISHDDIFSIAFSTAGSQDIQNEFIGKQPNKYLKTARVQRVKAAIDRLTTTGRISFDNLEKYLLLTGSTLQGISLKGIIP